MFESMSHNFQVYPSLHTHVSDLQSWPCRLMSGIGYRHICLDGLSWGQTFAVMIIATSVSLIEIKPYDSDI